MWPFSKWKRKKELEEKDREYLELMRDGTGSVLGSMPEMTYSRPGGPGNREVPHIPEGYMKVWRITLVAFSFVALVALLIQTGQIQEKTVLSYSINTSLGNEIWIIPTIIVLILVIEGLLLLSKNEGKGEKKPIWRIALVAFSFVSLVALLIQTGQIQEKTVLRYYIHTSLGNEVWIIPVIVALILLFEGLLLLIKKKGKGEEKPNQINGVGVFDRKPTRIILAVINAVFIYALMDLVPVLSRSRHYSGSKWIIFGAAALLAIITVLLFVPKHRAQLSELRAREQMNRTDKGWLIVAVLVLIGINTASLVAHYQERADRQQQMRIMRDIRLELFKQRVAIEAQTEAQEDNRRRSMADAIDDQLWKLGNQWELENQAEEMRRYMRDQEWNLDFQLRDIEQQLEDQRFRENMRQLGVPVY